MLTHEDIKRIKNLFTRNAISRIAAITGHDPKTIRKYLARKEDQEPQIQTQRDSDEISLVNIPIEAELICELVNGNAIPRNYRVFVPVPMDVAEQYIQIEKIFKRIENVGFKEQIEAVVKQIDGERERSKQVP